MIPFAFFLLSVVLPGCGNEDCTPGPDTCNGVDDDCDGKVDEDATWTRWYEDADGDGYGAGEGRRACSSPGDGWVDNGLDCDDADPDLHPGATEVCDGVDNDCDAAIDDEDSTLEDGTAFYLDEDGDGYGTGPGFRYCSPPGSGWVEEGDDCDDSDPSVNPGTAESCNGVDDDCDGLVDADDPDLAAQASWYPDEDGDGYGDASAEPVVSCDAPSGTVADASDCDDSDPSVNPAAVEVCHDGVDNDCDGGAPDCPPVAADATRDDAGATVDPCGGGSSMFRDVGDLDGDGRINLVAGTGSCAGAGYAGTVAVVPGIEPGRSYASADVSGAVEGDAAWPYVGTGIVVADDLSGDGYADLVAGTDDGSLLLYTGPITARIAASALDAAIRGRSSTSSAFGGDLAAGDLLGSGTDALVVGDPYYVDSGGVQTGAVWVLKWGGSSTVDLADGATLVGGASTSGAYLGWSVQAGDLDGDGLDDLLASAPYEGAGVVWAVLGWTSADTDLGNADVVLKGEASGDAFGWNFDAGADLDGDGYRDLVVGAPWNAGTGYGTGAAYVFSGPFTAPTASTSADATAVLVPDGTPYAAYRVAAVSSFYPDGSPVVALGDIGKEGVGGATYAGGVRIFAGPFEGTITAADASVTGDASYDYYGTALLDGDDLDGDGFHELLAGAYYDTRTDVFFGGEGL